MKKYLLSILLVLLLCFVASSQEQEADASSRDTEKELRTTFERWLKATKELDMDTLLEIEKDAIGYGYRTKAPRPTDDKMLRFGYMVFKNSMESFEISYNLDDFNYWFVDNVCIILGSFTEKFKPKDGELQTTEVRTSMTFIRIDGKWKLVQYHRDNQFAK